jgi:hypothetical protein
MGSGAKEGRPVTADEMAEAARRLQQMPGEMPRAVAEMVEAAGGPEALARMTREGTAARALGERDLTKADVDMFVTLIPVVQREGVTEDEIAAAFAKQGLGMLEWSMLSMRIVTARTALRLGMQIDDERVKADIEAIRPHLDRIDKATGGE